jgi:hypothetical protein
MPNSSLITTGGRSATASSMTVLRARVRRRLHLRLPGRYTPTHRNTQLPGRRYGAPYRKCSTHRRVPTGSAAPVGESYGCRPRHRPLVLGRVRGPEPLHWAGSACPAPTLTLPPPAHRRRPGNVDVRPDWQHHDPTNKPDIHPRTATPRDCAASQVLPVQSDRTHQSGQPRASLTPAGQGTPTRRTGPRFKVTTRPTDGPAHGRRQPPPTWLGSRASPASTPSRTCGGTSSSASCAAWTRSPRAGHTVSSTSAGYRKCAVTGHRRCLDACRSSQASTGRA